MTVMTTFENRCVNAFDHVRMCVSVCVCVYLSDLSYS